MRHCETTSFHRAQCHNRPTLRSVLCSVYIKKQPFSFPFYLSTVISLSLSTLKSLSLSTLKSLSLSTLSRSQLPLSEISLKWRFNLSSLSLGTLSFSTCSWWWLYSILYPNLWWVHKGGFVFLGRRKPLCFSVWVPMIRYAFQFRFYNFSIFRLYVYVYMLLCMCICIYMLVFVLISVNFIYGYVFVYVCMCIFSMC